MQKTFAQILAEAKLANVTALIKKAHSASCLAKACGGMSRDRLYAAKTRALCRAVEIDPEDFQPVWSNARQSFVLLRCRVAPSLHAPVRSLTPEVRAMIDERERRIA